MLCISARGEEGVEAASVHTARHAEALLIGAASADRHGKRLGRGAIDTEGSRT